MSYYPKVGDKVVYTSKTSDPADARFGMIGEVCLVDGHHRHRANISLIFHPKLKNERGEPFWRFDADPLYWEKLT